MFGARLKAFRQLPPRAYRVVTSAAALRFTLSTAHRVIDRVHYHAAHVRSPALPTGPAGLAARHVHMIDVTDLANRGISVLVDPANFARRHFYQGVATFQVVQ